MADNRAKNAAQPKNKRNAGTTRQAAPLRAARKPEPEPAQPLLGSGTGRDLAAVGLAVVAVASLIAVVAPSTAPVTQAIASFYHAGFGLGAYLIPLVLLALSVLLFARTGLPVRGRSLVGGLMVLVGVLGLLALLVRTGTAGAGASADMQRDTFFGYAHLSASGGYVGALPAYALQSAFGTLIAAVVLVGVVAAGLVVLGLSIGSLVQGARDRAEALIARHRPTYNETPWGEEPSFAATNAPFASAAASQGFASPGATAFAAASATSVLSRPAGVDYGEDPFVPVDDVPADEAPTTLLSDLGEGPAPKTTLLPHRRKRAGKKAAAEQTQELASEETTALAETPVEEPPTTVLPNRAAAENQEPSRSQTARKNAAASDSPSSEASSEPAVPDFLKQAAAQAVEKNEKIAAQTPEGSGNAAVRTAKRAAKAVATAAAGLPPMSLLRSNPQSAASAVDRAELEQTAASLQSTLAEFNLHARVVGLIAGPTVTTYKVQMGEGERVSKIQNLEDDIALSLAAEAVRIFAPIPGTSLVGVEVPNRTRQTVSLGDVLPYAKGGPLELAIGRDVEGAPVVADLAKMPHLLIAGSTGSGKSVMINAILSSILMRAVPEDVRLIMVDPKRVELSGYNGLPHLYVPVVTEPKQAASALSWGVAEMERRLKIFERLNVRNIGTFNKKQAAGAYDGYDNPPAKMPYLVIIIDELSDLMMVAGKDVEASIVRIAQLGRAAGIHLIVATQRPSSDVVTGLIKANIINRIAFKVATGIDSRVIIDQVGAEKLIGLGDMLFSKVDWGKPKRIQGCFVSDEEIAQIVAFWKEHATPEYHEEILSAVTPAMGAGGGGGHDAGDDDPLVWEAADIVVESGLGSTSGLQRRLKVGYARAGRIMDMLEEKGVVGPPDGSKPREVLLDPEGLEELKRFEQQTNGAN